MSNYVYEEKENLFKVTYTSHLQWYDSTKSFMAGENIEPGKWTSNNIGSAYVKLNSRYDEGLSDALFNAYFLLPPEIPDNYIIKQIKILNHTINVDELTYLLGIFSYPQECEFDTYRIGFNDNFIIDHSPKDIKGYKYMYWLFLPYDYAGERQWNANLVLTTISDNNQSLNNGNGFDITVELIFSPK